MKVLYIVSSPHGGSTLFSLVMGRHARAANLGEVAFIPKLLAMRELCTCGARLAECAEWGRAFDLLAQRTHVDMRRAPYGLFLGDAIKAKGGSGLIDHAHQTLVRRVVAKVRGAVDTAILLAAPTQTLLRSVSLPSVRNGIRNTMEFYRAAADAWDKSLLIDASKHPKKAPHLYIRNPTEVRVLHLVRDGRAVITSRSEYMDTAHAAGRWHHYHKLTRRLLQRWIDPAHRRSLRYEDFVEAPETHLRALCSWLDLDYSSEMLQFSTETPLHSAGGNPARFRISGGIRPVDDRWKTEASAEQLATFERIAGTLNREFGYE